MGFGWGKSKEASKPVSGDTQTVSVYNMRHLANSGQSGRGPGVAGSRPQNHPRPHGLARVKRKESEQWLWN